MRRHPSSESSSSVFDTGDYCDDGDDIAEYKQKLLDNASRTPILVPTLFLITTSLSSWCYLQTLEGGDTEQWLHSKLYGMAMWMVLSDVFWMTALLLALSMEGWKWRRGMLAYSFVSSLLLFAWDQGNTVQHHGAYVLIEYCLKYLFTTKNTFPTLHHHFCILSLLQFIFSYE